MVLELITPMEPILSKRIITEKDWIHQIKWDGIRGITYIEDGEVRIYTKKGHERIDFYPEIEDTVKLLAGEQAVLDGEIVIFDEEGRPSFTQVLKRERVRSKANLAYYVKKYPIKYIIFDIMYLNGVDLRQKPLYERKEILLENFQKSSNITITDDFDDGHALFELMREKKYEGIVSKQIFSRYIAGKKHDKWYKTKINKKILTVICGVKFKNKFPNTLLLGIYQDGQLIFIGNASIGLKQKDLILLKENIDSLSQEQCPFTNHKPKYDDITWLQPLLTCWVRFMEWTNHDSLRHPQIIGFSTQKPLDANGKEFIE